MLRNLVGLALIAAAQLASAPAAMAEFKLCNDSQLPEISMAYGFDDKEKGWTARGWWKVKQGDCVSVISEGLNGRKLYAYAFGFRPEGRLRIGWPELAEGAGMTFCVDPKGAFALPRSGYASGSILNCEANGYAAINFREVAAPTPGAAFRVQPDARSAVTTMKAQCEQEPSTKSPRTARTMVVYFANGRPSNVKLYWVDHDGKRALQTTIEAGKTHTQPTFVGHSWLVTDMDENCVGFFVTQATQRQLVIQ